MHFSCAGSYSTFDVRGRDGVRFAVFVPQQKKSVLGHQNNIILFFTFLHVTSPVSETVNL